MSFKQLQIPTPLQHTISIGVQYLFMEKGKKEKSMNRDIEIDEEVGRKKRFLLQNAFIFHVRHVIYTRRIRLPSFNVMIVVHYVLNLAVFFAYLSFYVFYIFLIF